MTASFQLALDTHAPRLTWGAVDGAVAGEELVVGYAVDEQGVTSATATLRDGRVLTMEVTSNALRVALPDDTPDGAVTVTANLRDDVWNATTATVTLSVSGVGYVAPPPVPVGQPAAPGAVQRGLTVRMGDSSARARDRYDAATVLSSTSRAVTGSLYIAPTTALHARTEAIAVASSTARTRSVVANNATTRTGSRWTTTKRPEGPDTEAALVALGLI